MEQEKKKGGGKLIIGLLIGLLIGAGCSYIYFSILNPKEVTTEKTTTSNSVKADNSVKECAKVYDTYDEIATTNLEKFMEAEGYYCGTEHIYFTDKKITTADIPYDMAYNTISSKYFDNKSTISADQIKKDVQEYFGKDYNYQGNDVLKAGNQCSSHYYDPATNTYPYQETACGGTCGPNTPLYTITKVVEDGNNLVLDLRVVFRETENTYYSDPQKTLLISDAYNDLSALKKGSKYLFTLKNENGNYVFVSSEPVA